MVEKPVIYQLLPRLFGNRNPVCVPDGAIGQNGCGKFGDITTSVLRRLRDLGATHVWYTGVIEHASTTDYSSLSLTGADNPSVVKGKAGSPYAIKDYYDVDPDLAVNPTARMKEFEALIRRTHHAGMGVIMDFVPNHTARAYHSDAKSDGVQDFGESDDTNVRFSPTNDYYYIVGEPFSAPGGDNGYVEFPAKASGNDCYSSRPSSNDWYETAKLNYGIDPSTGTGHFTPRPPVWDKMLDILLFWAGKGVDGFRCDMVHMVPVEFWEWAITEVRKQYPAVKFLGELYDPAIYHKYIFQGGFDYLYDKVGLYDTLRAVETGNATASAITGAWQSVDGIQPRMLSFLENHDEQRFASRFYAGPNSDILPSLVVMSMISTGPVMLYMGQELGEQAADAEGFSGADGRTTIFDYWSVPSLRRWLEGHSTKLEKSIREKHRQVLRLCNSEEAVRMGQFFDLMYVNGAISSHVYAFIRSTSRETLLIVANFGTDETKIDLNIPSHAFETLGLAEDAQSEWEDLLTGTRLTGNFSSSAPMRLTVGRKDALVLKRTR